MSRHLPGGSRPSPTFPVVLCALLALVGYGCGGDQPRSGAAPAVRPSPGAEPGGGWFVERAAAAGIDFVHFNGMSGEYYYPEIMAPGLGLVDYDNDGDLDLYLVQGQMLGKTIKDALFPPRGPLRDRLFRNDLTLGQRRADPAFH